MSSSSSFNKLASSAIARFNLRKATKWSGEIVLILAVVRGISLWQTRNMLETDGSATIPDMQLVSMQGNVESLFDSRGHTLVYFWAPWCSVCAISIGSLDNVDNEDLNIVTIAMDFDSIESVEAFVNEHNVSSKVLLGNEQIRQFFQVQGYPSYYLVNKEAKVVAKSFGLNTSIGIKLNHWLSKT